MLNPMPLCGTTRHENYGQVILRLDRRIQLLLFLDPAIKSQDDCPNKRWRSKNVIAGISETFSGDCFVAGAPRNDCYIESSGSKMVSLATCWKRLFPGCEKNIQMQGTRNPEE
jgi:hypothetical protein